MLIAAYGCPRLDKQCCAVCRTLGILPPTQSRVLAGQPLPANHRRRSLQVWWFRQRPYRELNRVDESGGITPWYYGYGWALRREAQALEARNALAVGCAAALSDGLSQPCSLAIFLPEGSPRFAAILTNSAKDSAFIFLIARPRWILSIMTACETLTGESSW